MRLLVILLVCLTQLGIAQEQDYIHSVTIPKPMEFKSDISNKYADLVSPSALKNHLSIIASDEFEGRGTGEPGIEKAAKYIAAQLRNSGIKSYKGDNAFYQPIAISFSGWAKDNQEMKINGKEFKHLWDYLAFPNKIRQNASFDTDEVIFLGYGVEGKRYNDYKKVNVKGKTIIIYDGEPKRRDGRSWMNGQKDSITWDVEKKLITARKHGVANVLIIENDIKKKLSENRRKILGLVTTVGKHTDKDIKGANHYFISSTMAKEIIGDKLKKVIKSRERAAKKGRAKSVKIPVKLSVTSEKSVKILEGKNIIAMIPGSDPDLRDEIVVLSAHYDHLGRKGDVIYNGADDNGSGTTTVLTIAQALQKAYEDGNGPKRPIAIIFLTGEEKGLLGSSYFVEHPVIPLEDIMVDVNVDMVGRVDKKYEETPNYIYVIGSDRLSTDLHKINEKVNQDYTGLIMDYTYNSEKDPNRYYYRSDHYNFASNGIPAIFFFNGTHKDYHQPSDTFDKINYQKMAKIGQHILHLVWDLANRSEPINVDGIVK